MNPADRIFEDDVRAVARQLWPEASFHGAAMIAGRERDGVFLTEDVAHIVECTTSRRKDKADYDIRKIIEAAKDIRARHPSKVVLGWFITLNEPEAQQRTIVAKLKPGFKINVCSFDDFRARLVDVRTYLQLRANYLFGSMVNLSGDNTNVPIDEYVPMDMVNKGTNLVVSLESLVDDLRQNPVRAIITGDYGAGKSTTLREIFFKLRDLYFSRTSQKFPVYLNLRDHQGQQDPDEALSRHAKAIGFSPGEQLVRAWRAGYVDLLLDGFDELAGYGWVGTGKTLRYVRFEAMVLVRKFISESPERSSIIVTGRQHYFDTDSELEKSLSLTAVWRFLGLTDFTGDQVAAYVRKKNLQGILPDWLPARPLLVGYLLSKGALHGQPNAGLAVAPEEGWPMLLQRICKREAAISSSIDGDTLKLIVERIATVCRGTTNGLGPISNDDIEKAFQEVVGFQPDAKARVLLMRLPGLGIHAPEDGTRRFIDLDFAAAAAAGDLMRFVADPFNFSSEQLCSAQSAAADLTQAIVHSWSEEHDPTGRKIVTAVSFASRLKSGSVLCCDILEILRNRDIPYDEGSIVVHSVAIDKLSLWSGNSNYSKLEYRSCIVGSLEIEENIDAASLPRFYDSFFYNVEGRISTTDLPPGVFLEGCEFAGFAKARTSAEIMRLEISMGLKVLLTVLKKLFIQRGSGRRESALHRGMDHRARRLVPSVLALIQSHGIATAATLRGQQVWLPLRGQTSRVRRILAAPSESKDALVTSAGNLE